MELGRVEEQLDDLVGAALHPLPGGEHLRLPLLDQLHVVVEASHHRAAISVEPLAKGGAWTTLGAWRVFTALDAAGGFAEVL